MSQTTYLICVTLITCIVTSAGTKPNWYWTWSCVDGTCLRGSQPNEPNGTTLEICKALCGKYRTLWPMPTGQTVLGHRLVFFHPSKMRFDFSHMEHPSAARDYMQKVSKLFQSKMLRMCGPNCTLQPETELVVTFKVTSSDLQLNWETDESYSLEISKREVSSSRTPRHHDVIDIKIKSTTVYGARHGLETVTQLVISQTPDNAHGLESSFLAVVSSAHIIDSPVYPHRGLLLDSSRHYLPVSAIEKTLDAMAMTKMNVLHWHVTDTQSFPLETPRVPQLYRYGSYSSQHVYTVKDTISLIEYARLRGIRVMIEIDGPAHAGNGWQWGESSNLGKLALCVNQKPWRHYCIQPPCGQLNPVNPNLYEVLKNVFADVVELLPPGEPLHMGGDEVFFPCWNSSREVVQWMENNNISRTEDGFLELWGRYQEQVLQVFSQVNPVADVPVILWSSSLTEPNVIEKYLNKSRYVIETWLPASSPIPRQLLNKGYRLILSTKDRWYLDHGFWGNTVYHGWKVAYNNRLPNHPGVLGGEAAMWSERVDEHSLDTKIWPRTAAVGERLWTNPSSGANDAEQRFENFRQRLVENGIDADATSPYFCYQNDNECA